MPDKPTSYFELAALNDAPAGRYAKPKPRIVGGDPAPPLPVADWNRPVVPDEPPIDGRGEGLTLGIDVSGKGGP
jgi:hypothetical protein